MSPLPDRPIPSIHLHDDAWTHSGPQQDPTARLLATVYLNGIPMHVEAYALEPDFAVQAFAALPAEAEFTFNDEQDAFWTLASHQAVQTHEIRGRTYVLVATPHGD